MRHLIDRCVPACVLYVCVYVFVGKSDISLTAAAVQGRVHLKFVMIPTCISYFHVNHLQKLESAFKHALKTFYWSMCDSRDFCGEGRRWCWSEFHSGIHKWCPVYCNALPRSHPSSPPPPPGPNFTNNFHSSFLKNSFRLGYVDCLYVYAIRHWFHTMSKAIKVRMVWHWCLRGISLLDYVGQHIDACHIPFGEAVRFWFVSRVLPYKPAASPHCVKSKEHLCLNSCYWLHVWWTAALTRLQLSGLCSPASGLVVPGFSSISLWDDRQQYPAVLPRLTTGRHTLLCCLSFSLGVSTLSYFRSKSVFFL